MYKNLTFGEEINFFYYVIVWRNENIYVRLKQFLSRPIIGHFCIDNDEKINNISSVAYAGSVGAKMRISVVITGRHPPTAVPTIMPAATAARKRPKRPLALHTARPEFIVN